MSTLSELRTRARRLADAVRVPRYSFQERNLFASSQALYSDRGYMVHRYNLNGNNITFIPEPNSTDTVKVWYIPTFVKLVNDSDTVDGNIALNWEDYAVTLAALKMREKEETSTTSLERELQRINLRIEEASSSRDAGEPMGIVDEDSGVAAGHWLFG